MVVAVAAAALSGVALKHSRESAKAAKQSADAAERSAAADEATLADMREEAAERRAVAAEAARPKPDLQVIHVSGVRYAIQNIGSGAAVNVTTVLAGVADRYMDLPGGVTLQRGDRHEFRILTAAELAPLTAIHVTWDGQPTPVALPIPPS